MTDYVALVTFPDNSKTYEAYAKLSNTTGGLGAVAAAILERDESGALKLTQGDDANLGIGTLGGTAIGLLVGVLGGPLGMLLGAGVGAATGSLYDLDRADTGDDVISEVSKQIPAGRNGILAQTSEADTSALDAFVADQGGTITRRPLEEVVSELEAQQAAAEAAAKAARDAVRDQKRQERKESWQERVDALKARFQRNDGDGGSAPTS